MEKKIKELLDYQSAHIAVLRLQKDAASPSDTLKFEQTRQQFNQAKANFAEAEVRAEKVLPNIEAAEREYSKLSSLLDKLFIKGESLVKEADLEAHLKEVSVMKDKITSLEKTLFNNLSSGEKIVSAHRKAKELGAKFLAEHKAVKERMEKVSNEKAPQLEAAKLLAGEKRKLVDKELLQRYDALVVEKKIPALAGTSSADGNRTFSCQGCGIGISQAAKAELVASGFSKCDSCRRMIYK